MSRLQRRSYKFAVYVEQRSPHTYVAMARDEATGAFAFALAGSHEVAASRAVLAVLRKIEHRFEEQAQELSAAA